MLVHKHTSNFLIHNIASGVTAWISLILWIFFTDIVLWYDLWFDPRSRSHILGYLVVSIYEACHRSSHGRFGIVLAQTAHFLAKYFSLLFQAFKLIQAYNNCLNTISNFNWSMILYLLMKILKKLNVKMTFLNLSEFKHFILRTI